MKAILEKFVPLKRSGDVTITLTGKKSDLMELCRLSEQEVEISLPQNTADAVGDKIELNNKLALILIDAVKAVSTVISKEALGKFNEPFLEFMKEQKEKDKYPDGSLNPGYARCLEEKSSVEI